jgi:hypothetical protein
MKGELQTTKFAVCDTPAEPVNTKYKTFNPSRKAISLLPSASFLAGKKQTFPSVTIPPVTIEMRNSRLLTEKTYPINSHSMIL